MTISFKFVLGILHVCFKQKEKLKNIKFYTLHLDNNLPNIENIYYIHYITSLQNAENELSGTLNTNIHT